MSFAAMTAVLLLGVSAAHAGSVQQQTISLDPSSVDTGATFSLTIGGFNCGVPVEVTITPTGGTPTTLTTISETDITGGAATVTGLTAPGTPGTYIVEARYTFECRGSAAAPLEVLQATTTTTTTTTTIAPTTSTTIAEQVAPTTAAATTTAAPAALPATGQTSDALVWAALTVLLAGGGLVMVAARRS